MKHIFLSFILCICSWQKETKPVTFGIVSDLHQDIAHHADERLKTFRRKIPDDG